MLLPKIHRNSMLPPMCRIEACMNMPVKTVSQVGRTPVGAPKTPGCPWQAIASPLTSPWIVARPQCLPGCVSAYGIAPYLTISCTSGPLISEPPWWTAST